LVAWGGVEVVAVRLGAVDASETNSFEGCIFGEELAVEGRKPSCCFAEL
jgi:hypothetical protein